MGRALRAGRDAGRRDRRRGLARMLVVWLAVAALVSGCGGLPDTSAPVEGGRLDAEPAREPLRVVPPGPREGASQEDIARGFIRAGEDPDESRSVGTSFLAPDSEALWRGGTLGIVVFDSWSDLTVTPVDEATVEVSVVAVATVSPDGRYEEQERGATVSVEFGMTKVSGEWRAELPPSGFGLWLDSSSFDRLYDPHNVYYVTTTGRRLVPDTRWFPIGRGLATTLARAQLDPPPPHLRDAVTTGVPIGTALAVNAVPVENGLARVDLTERVLEADPVEREAMWAQMAATLAQVGSVQQVSILAGGAELELPELGTTIPVSADLGYARPGVVRTDSTLVRAKDGSMSRIDPRFVPERELSRTRGNAELRDGDPVKIAPGWVQLAQDYDEQQVAAVGRDGTGLARWGGGYFSQARPFAAGLVSPVYDREGYLWVGARGSDGSAGIYAGYAASMQDEPLPMPVEATWLDGRRVRRLTVAPDGARILVLSEGEEGGTRLDLAGIVRSSTLAPLRLTEPLQQGTALARMSDVVWLNNDEVAVLGRLSPSDDTAAWVIEIGAGTQGVRRRGLVDAESLRQPPVPSGRPVSLTSVAELRGLIVITDRDEVWALVGATWQKITTATDLLAPGR